MEVHDGEGGASARLNLRDCEVATQAHVRRSIPDRETRTREEVVGHPVQTDAGSDVNGKVLIDEIHEPTDSNVSHAPADPTG